MVGVTLNSYTIVKKINEGGMGEIYLAEHKFLERKAAVKVLHKTYSSNKDIRQRFIQEAQTLSRFDHPHIVKIFDFDQYQDVFYIIMEFISGYTLDEYTRIKNGLMPEHIAKEFFTKVLSAVNYAHNNSVVHRDIKPSNIMIDANNEPKILDFGIARLINADQRVTKVNTKMGSILYMSPEQILGKEVDFKSDIYSLGITLYETLTAKHPYEIEEDSDYTLQSKILNDYPPPPTAYYPLITMQMEFVISKAINKDPSERFSSCLEFSEAINDPYYSGDYLFSNVEVISPEPHTRKGIKPKEVNGNGFDSESITNVKESETLWKGSETRISDSQFSSESTEYKNQNIQNNLVDLDKNTNFKKNFYGTPAFYFSILFIVLICFTGIALFYYYYSDEVAESNNIIKVDTAKTIVKTPPPPPIIDNSKDDSQKITTDTKGNNTFNRSKKNKSNNNSNYNGTNNNSSPTPKKSKTTFE